MQDSQHLRILELHRQLFRLELNNWQKDSFLHWHWWVELTATILFFCIWWILVDKKRPFQILSYALIMALLNCLIDSAMVNLGWYAYPHRLLPFWSGYIVGDFSFPPVVFSLIYQKYSKWSSFAIAAVIASAIMAFIFEPILLWAGTYELYRWSLLYSFPVYLLIAASSKWLVDLIHNKSSVC